MIALLKLLLSGIAAEKGAAVLFNAINKVLAGHADHPAFPTLQLPIINKVPLLHHPSTLVQLY